MDTFYPFDVIKLLVADDHYHITFTARSTAALLGFGEAEILDCILHHLNRGHFYKTMASEKVAGLMQDVYRTTYRKRNIYLKLQINSNTKAVVISFKQDTGSGLRGDDDDDDEWEGTHG